MAKRIVNGDMYGSFGTSLADTFHVYGANNTLVGGAGNDTYNIYNENNYAYGNTILENSGGGIDTVNYFGWSGEGTDYTYLADNVENLNLRAYADVAYGNALGNVMRADAGDMWESAVMFGGDGNDTLFGSHYGDSLYGDGGNDTITGGDFNDDDDFIYGGDGNDVLSGGNVNYTSNQDTAGYGGDDSIYGQAGNDTISGGDVTILGSTGYGYHSGYAGDDNLEGGTGDDLILGGNDQLRMIGLYGFLYGGEDWLYGDAGNDTILGGNNVLYGATSSPDWGGYNSAWGSFDTLYGSAGNDVLRGGNTTINGGGNYLKAYGGYGSFYGMAGNDSMVAGNNLIRMGDGGGYGYGNSRDAGTWSGDEMFGGAGNDTMHSGATTVIGGRGRDYITGSGEVMYGDIYSESEEDFEESGGNGNDLMTDGVDLLEGGAGEDTLYGGYNMLYGDGGNDTIVGGSMTLRGGAGDDTIYGGNDRLYGGDGNDLITAGNEFIDGGTGHNVIVNGYSVMYGDDGNDTLIGANTGDRIYGGDGNDSMLGNAGNDVIDAGDHGADFADGGAGDDTVYGSDHGDTIAGGLGDDILSINFWYGGSITVSDAGGDDRLIVHGDRAGTFTLAAGIEGLTNHAAFTTLVGNTLDNFIEGNGGTETLLGLAGNDVLDGREGGDRLVGGAGNDFYTVYTANDVVVENALEGNDTVYAYGAYGVLPGNVENLILGVGAGYGAIRGNSSANLLMGNVYGNVIEGAGGNDTIDGGDGADVLIGGAGDDSYTIRDSRAVIIEQAGGGTGTDSVRIFDAEYYRLGNNIENAVLGDAFHDVAYGVTGNASNNRLEGNKWDNTLDGGAGTDTLIGGAGDDDYTVDSTADVITEAAGGGDDWVYVRTTASTGTFTMAANVEGLVLYGASGLGVIGNLGDNEIIGNAGANSIDGGAGNDDIDGRGGNDTLNGGLTGNDTLDGGRGSDSMIGGAGNDTYYVDRGDGAGTAITTGEDIVNETLAGGGTADRVISSVYTYSLGAQVENLELFDSARKGFGNELANTITGNGYNNQLGGLLGDDTLSGGAGSDTLTGDGGNDRLDGGTGLDTMVGGTGNDTFLADNAGDLILENASSGTDVVLSTAANFTLAANVENLTLTGGSFNGTGNTGANVITGNANNNNLFGDAGNDTLVGNDGYDTLDGGTGNDSMSGGTGDDTYYVDVTADVVNEGVNWGYDEVVVETNAVGFSYTLAANVEYLTLSMNEGEGISTANHNATGNALHNEISGNAGNNSLSGLGGEDTITGGTGNDTLVGGDANDDLSGDIGDDTLSGDAGNDSMDGGAGNDSMTGGLGDDFYVVDASADTVVETTLAGAGSDEVQVVRSGTLTAYTLAAEVENLSTTGSGAMTLVGNGLGNAFEVGQVNAGDSFDGGKGSDSIFGVLNNAGTAAASLTSFDSAVFEVYLDNPLSAWTLDVNGGTAVTLRDGAIYNDADLSVTGLGADAVVTISNLSNNSTGSLLTLGLDDASGEEDRITVDVTDDAVQNLGIAGVETVAFSFASDYAHFNVAGVTGETLLTVTGGISGDGSLELSGLDDTQMLLFQNFSSDTVILGLGDDSGIDSIELGLDNAQIGDLDLSTGLDTLTLDTRGDLGFANGGSSIDFGSVAGTTALELVGGQSLTLEGVTSTTVDASGLSGALTLNANGMTTFTAGSGDTSVFAANTNTTFNFGTELDENDAVYDNANPDADVLNAEFVDGDVIALTITNVETLNFDVSGDVMLDFSGVNPGTGTSVDIDSDGEDLGPDNVTIDLNDNPVGAIHVNAAGLVDGTLHFIGGSGGAGSTVTGSAGDDTLNGGLAADVLSGGAGNDSFVFDDQPTGLANADAITDFTAGSDKLQVSLTIFGDVGPLGTLGAGMYESGAGLTAATDTDVRFFLNTSTGYLYYDADGSGTVEAAVQFAWMSGPPALTEADFEIIS